jgi:hypothetical protein
MEAILHQIEANILNYRKNGSDLSGQPFKPAVTAFPIPRRFSNPYTASQNPGQLLKPLGQLLKTPVSFSNPR